MKQLKLDTKMEYLPSCWWKATQLSRLINQYLNFSDQLEGGIPSFFGNLSLILNAIFSPVIKLLQNYIFWKLRFHQKMQKKTLITMPMLP
jgi:hypothetical protein